jgi:hypothetical protein
LENYKPFECVWTYDESLLSAKKVIKNKNIFWIILDNLKEEILEKCDDETEKKLEEKLLKIEWGNSIPESFSKLLK